PARRHLRWHCRDLAGRSRELGAADPRRPRLHARDGRARRALRRARTDHARRRGGGGGAAGLTAAPGRAGRTRLWLRTCLPANAEKRAAPGGRYAAPLMAHEDNGTTAVIE